MSNYTIFGSTTGGGAITSTLLKNISNTTLPNDEQLLVVEDDSVVSSVPISSYGKTLLNSISLAQLKADLDGSPTAVSVNDNGTGEVNITVDGDSNLRLQVKDAETNVYNELRLHNGAVNASLKMNSSTLEAKSNNGKVLVEGVNGVELKKNGVNVLVSSGANLQLYKPSDGSLKMTIGGNIDFGTNIIGTGFDIGASGFPWNNVYSNTNNSTNYTIADGGSISIGSTQIFKFLEGTSSGLANHYLYQLPANKVARFTELNATTNFLEFDTIANDINIGVPLNTQAINTTSVSLQATNTGYVTLQTANPQSGYVEFYRPNNTRSMYIGFAAPDTGAGGLNLDMNFIALEWGDLRIKGGDTYAENLLPSDDDTYALGSSSKRFTELNATNGTIQTSDIRQKTAISRLHNGLELINSLKPVSFKWKENGVRTHLGLIAQDVEQTDLRNTAVFIHDKTSDRMGLRYTELISPIIKAVQELDAKFNKLGSEGIIIKEVYKDEKQENDFSNIKNLLKSMKQPQESVVDEEYKQKLESIEIKNKIISEKYDDLHEKHNNLLEQVEQLKSVIEEKPEPEAEDEEPESDSGNSVLDIIQQRLFELEKKQTKLDNKVKRISTIVNKLVKQ